METRLHTADRRYDKMMRKAHGIICWPGMKSDVKQMVDCHKICQEKRPKNCKEPLIQHSTCEFPWQKIWLDLFKIREKQYVISVGHFFNFIEVDYLSTTTNATAISMQKNQFSKFGYQTLQFWPHVFITNASARKQNSLTRAEDYQNVDDKNTGGWNKPM